MSETSDQNDQTISEIRNELEGELMREGRDRVRPGLLAGLRGGSIPRRLAAPLAALAFAAAGAGVAVAATGGGGDEQPLPPPELAGITSSSGESIEFKCQADRQWFFDEIGGDEGLRELLETNAPFPTPPEGICDGSPPLTDGQP